MGIDRTIVVGYGVRVTNITHSEFHEREVPEGYERVEVGCYMTGRFEYLIAISETVQQTDADLAEGLLLGPEQTGDYSFKYRVLRECGFELVGAAGWFVGMLVF